MDSNLKHSNLDFVDFFIYRLNGKYENGFAKRFPWTVVFFPANYACTFKTTVLENSLKNAFSNFPPKKQKERISKKRFLSVEIRFRIWRSISNLKSGIQNPNPADFPIERNLSKLQFRKLLSSGSTFTPKWLSDLVLADDDAEPEGILEGYLRKKDGDGIVSLQQGANKPTCKRITPLCLRELPCFFSIQGLYLYNMIRVWEALR